MSSGWRIWIRGSTHRSLRWVIVWVIGTVATHTAPWLAQRVGQQLPRAPHVVVDLGEVTVLAPRALAALFQTATASGSEIPTAGAEHDAVRRAPRITDLDQLLSLDPTTDAVIAGFRAGPAPAAVLAAADPARRIGMGRPATQAGVSTDDITGGAAARSYTQQGCGGSS